MDCVDTVGPRAWFHAVSLKLKAFKPETHAGKSNNVGKEGVRVLLTDIHIGTSRCLRLKMQTASTHMHTYDTRVISCMFNKNKHDPKIQNNPCLTFSIFFGKGLLKYTGRIALNSCSV